MKTQKQQINDEKEGLNKEEIASCSPQIPNISLHNRCLKYFKMFGGNDSINEIDISSGSKSHIKFPFTQ